MCGFPDPYVRPCNRVDSPRKCASGPVGLDPISFSVTAVKTSGAIILDDPGGSAWLTPAWCTRRATGHQPSLGADENPKLKRLEKFIIIGKQRLGQIHQCMDRLRPSNPCVAERRASWGGTEERSQEVSEIPPRQPSCKPQRAPRLDPR
jgi:hypothetical protein